jgi:geranylgeranyl diphosphate synthase type I
MTASTHLFTPHDLPDLPAARAAVDATLRDFLDHKARTAADGCPPAEAVRHLRGFLFAGGKRLRPLLCVCGWHAAAGCAETAQVIGAAASLEMFHAFALIHDDVMDHSATRRGRPTLHRALAEHHHAHRSGADAHDLGVGLALLIGDLALAWSAELLHRAGLSDRQLTGVLALVDVMRTELMCGQYLDLLGAAEPTGDLARPLTVIRYKTAKYTIERPLHIGATLAGADRRILERCTAYALPVGEAFQLRDDLLGVYGDPEATGKSCLDDLREGKHTVLIALALQRADTTQRTTLTTLLGDPALDEHGATRIRTILTATGARAEVEHMIRERRRQAQQALDQANFPAAATAALHRIAEQATARHF